jgi:hypothetical protein
MPMNNLRSDTVPLMTEEAHERFKYYTGTNI